MTSDSEQNWVRHQHRQRREDAPASKGLPFMVMYITGAIGVCGIRVVRELDFLLAPLDTLETLYCGTTPGSQSQVCPHLSTIHGWPLTKPLTMAPPPWHATPDGQWHAKRIRLAPPTSKAALYYWRGTFRSWPFTTEGVPPSNRPNVLAHIASYIHKVVRQRDFWPVSQPHPHWTTGVA